MGSFKVIRKFIDVWYIWFFLVSFMIVLCDWYERIPGWFINRYSVLILTLMTLFFAILVFKRVWLEREKPIDRKELVTRDLSWIDVKYAIDQLISDIEYANFIPDIILGADKGGAIVAGILGKKLTIRGTMMFSTDQYSISSSLGSLDDGIKDPTKRTIEINKILLVDAACRSGTTMNSAIKNLEKAIEGAGGIEFKKAVILNVRGGIGGHRFSKPDLDFFIYETDNTNIKLPWDPEIRKYK